MKLSGTFSYYAELYLKRKKKNNAWKTFLQAEYILRMHLLRAFGPRPVNSIKEHEVIDYLVEKKESLKIYDHKKHFQGVLGLAREYGETLPHFRLKVFDPVAGRGKLYSRHEIARILWDLRRNKNLRLQFYSEIVTGMRNTSEALKLNVRQCTIKKTTIERKNQYGVSLRPIICKIVWIHLEPSEQKVKSTQGRDFPCNLALSRILIARMRRMKIKDRGFFYPSKAKTKSMAPHQLTNNTEWRRCRLRLKITGRMHDCRHTSCSQKLSQGFAEAFLKKTHAMSRATIDRYAHVPERDAVDAAIYGLKKAS
jgi:hypothetical protein